MAIETKKDVDEDAEGSGCGRSKFGIWSRYLNKTELDNIVPINNDGVYLVKKVAVIDFRCWTRIGWLKEVFTGAFGDPESHAELSWKQM